MLPYWCSKSKKDHDTNLIWNIKKKEHKNVLNSHYYAKNVNKLKALKNYNLNACKRSIIKN